MSATPELIRALEWTPEQQVQELLRRKRMTPTFDEKSSFTPRPSDVMVATPPKSGTTWLTHICHQLRMKGAEPDFNDQHDIVTFLEDPIMIHMNVDPQTRPQPAEPRVFFSHTVYPSIPKGGKIINCHRDMKDVAYSSYWFLDTMLSLKGRVSLPIFAKAMVAGDFVKMRLQDLLLWWDHRHDDDVLLLFFDDLKEDHAGCVRRIAKFTAIDCDEEVLARVVHTTTHAEMSRHHSKFDSRNQAVLFAKKIGEEPPAEFAGRVRKGGGRSGDGQALPPEVQQYIEEQWQEIVTAKLGFRNLKEMREAWHKEVAEGKN